VEEKGKVSRKAPNEIRLVGEKFGFSKSDVNRLVYSSKMSAKIDNTTKLKLLRKLRQYIPIDRHKS